MEVNVEQNRSLKYIYCSLYIFFFVQQNKLKQLYRKATWGWGNYDRIFLFGWTIPL